MYKDKTPYFVVTNDVDNNFFKYRLNNSDLFYISVQKGIPLRVKVSVKLKSMNDMFDGCNNMTSVDLSGLNMSEVTNMQGVFASCAKLVSVDFGTLKLTDENSVGARSFYMCESLNHIKCTQTLYDMLMRADAMNSKILPDAMKEGGSGTWEIVG